MNVYRSLKWFVSMNGFGLKTSVAPQSPEKWSQQEEVHAISTFF